MVATGPHAGREGAAEIARDQKKRLALAPCMTLGSTVNKPDSETSRQLFDIFSLTFFLEV